MDLVVDASVVVKWALPDPTREGRVETERADALLLGLRDRTLSIRQPPHWLAEAAAVLARLDPVRAPRAIGFLAALELPTRNEPSLYLRAADLAIRLEHHLFDTLYHAVALEDPPAVLVTADTRYYRKAAPVGRIKHLRDFTPG